MMKENNYIKYNTFLLKQIELNQQKKIKIIYRGDSLKKILKRFGVSSQLNKNNKNEFLKRIFLIGDKSKHFYNQNLLNFNKSPDYLNINYSTEDELTKIFNYYNRAIQSKKDYIITFFNENIELKKYFLNTKNCSCFVKSINSSKMNNMYRNYYLIILHQLYAIEYRKTTHFISTTTDKRIAYEFSGGNGVILHCWMPITEPKLAFSKYGLPKVKIFPFKEQKEETIFAGILPHYISAVEILYEKKTYINPSLFKNKVSEFMFINGFNIDQTQFEEYIIKTQFRKHFTIAGREIKEINQKNNNF